MDYFNSQTIIYNILTDYIKIVVVLTVVLILLSITTATVNAVLSSLSIFFFHPKQYNNHHFLSSKTSKSSTLHFTQSTYHYHIYNNIHIVLKTKSKTLFQEYFFLFYLLRQISYCLH